MNDKELKEHGASMRKLTDQEIEDFENIETLDIPFEYPDGDDEPSVVFLGRHNRKFLRKYIGLVGWGTEHKFRTTDSIEIKLDELIDGIYKAAEEREISEADYFKYKYIVSGKAMKDFMKQYN